MLFDHLYLNDCSHLENFILSAIYALTHSIFVLLVLHCLFFFSLTFEKFLSIKVSCFLKFRIYK